MRSGVAHIFRSSIEQEQILEEITVFFAPTFSVISNQEFVNLPPDLITGLNAEERRSFERVLAHIKNTAMDSPSVRSLAKDLSSGSWRGSTLNIARSLADDIYMRGALWAQGQGRFWTIQAHGEDESLLQAQTLTADQFRDQLETLVATG